VGLLGLTDSAAPETLINVNTTSAQNESRSGAKSIERSPRCFQRAIALPLTTKEERESELASSILEIGRREAGSPFEFKSAFTITGPGRAA
jgi:hypothetical protein